MEVLDVVGNGTPSNAGRILGADTHVTQRNANVLDLTDHHGRLFIHPDDEERRALISTAVAAAIDHVVSKKLVTLVTTRTTYWKNLATGITIQAFDDAFEVPKNGVLIVENVHVWTEAKNVPVDRILSRASGQQKVFLFTSAPVSQMFDRADATVASDGVSILFALVKGTSSLHDARLCMAKASANGDVASIFGWWAGCVSFRDPRSTTSVVQRRYLGRMTWTEHELFRSAEVRKLEGMDLTETRVDNNCHSKCQFVAHQVKIIGEDLCLVYSQFDVSLRSVTRLLPSVRTMSHTENYLMENVEHLFILEPPKDWVTFMRLLGLLVLSAEKTKKQTTVHRICWTRPLDTTEPPSDVFFRDLLFEHEIALETFYKGIRLAAVEHYKGKPGSDFPRWHQFNDSENLHESGAYERPELAEFFKANEARTPFRLQKMQGSVGKTKKETSADRLQQAVRFFVKRSGNWSDAQKEEFRDLLARIDPLLPNYEKLVQSALTTAGSAFGAERMYCM